MAAPLRGRTCVVAASEDRVQRLQGELESRGARVIPFPTVRLVPPKDLAALDQALLTWPTYDWIVFTSTHGVEAVVARARELRLDLLRLRGRIAAVGPATRKAAEAAGLPVHAVPEEFLTDRIADVLGDVRGCTVLLPRSKIARKSLAVDLRRRGALVVEVDAYEAEPASPDVDALASADRVDVILFTSASAAANFTALVPPEVLDRLKQEARVACIGPVTAEAARDLGFRVAAVAEEHTIPGLVESLTEVSIHG